MGFLLTLIPQGQESLIGNFNILKVSLYNYDRDLNFRLTKHVFCLIGPLNNFISNHRREYLF